jgi:hypothetical protein
MLVLPHHQFYLLIKSTGRARFRVSIEAWNKLGDISVQSGPVVNYNV